MSDLVATITQVRGTSTSEGVTRSHRRRGPESSDFTLQDAAGRRVSLADFSARKVADTAKHPAQVLEAVHGAA